MSLISRAQATAWHIEENGQESVTYVANLTTSEISALTGPSESIWLELETPLGLDELVGVLADFYGEAPETIAPDVEAFVQQLQEMQLLTVDPV